MSGILLAIALGLQSQAVHCGTVEVNTFGERDNTSTAILYRDFNGAIMAWRWLGDGRRVPHLRLGGWLVTSWEENGRLISVFCRRVVKTRTLVDVESVEREAFPAHARRGLK